MDTMMGAPLFFPAIFFKKFQRGFFGFFIPTVNLTNPLLQKHLPNFCYQKIEQKNPGGLPVATASFFWGQISVLWQFFKKNKICQIFPYKLPKIGGKKILENSHLVQASNRGIK
jgi:hypothetical protein